MLGKRRRRRLHPGRVGPGIIRNHDERTALIRLHQLLKKAHKMCRQLALGYPVVPGPTLDVQPAKDSPRGRNPHLLATPHPHRPNYRQQLDIAFVNVNYSGFRTGLNNCFNYGPLPGQTFRVVR